MKSHFTNENRPDIMGRNSFDWKLDLDARSNDAEEIQWIYNILRISNSQSVTELDSHLLVFGIIPNSLNLIISLFQDF